MNEDAIQKKAVAHFRQLEDALGTFTFTAVVGGSVRVPIHIGKRLKDMGAKAGWTDLMFVADKQVIFIELKANGGRPSDRQKIFFKILDRFNQPNYCIECDDEHDCINQITGILRAHRVGGV